MTAPAALLSARESFEREALVHIDALYRVALRFVGNAADAEDLVQDTLFRAYQAWDQYEPGTNAKGWLLAILRNLFINVYRRGTRRRELLQLHAFEPDFSSPDPEDAFYDGLIDEEIVRAIDSLPREYREIVMLRDVESLHYDEIAAALGVPLGTVKSRLFRAREILQARLHDYAVRAGRIKPRQIPAARAS